MLLQANNFTSLSSHMHIFFHTHIENNPPSIQNTPYLE
jgi:hypothetical protein